MVTDKDIIFSADQVASRVMKDTALIVSNNEVRNVMKRDLDMSYQKMKRSALHANSEYNLVLRQRYAIKMFTLTQKKTVFLNIDETWLDASDYTRHGWQQRSSSCSVPLLQVRPRISMITGLDSLGNIYLSLTQSNSNQKVMEVFFRQLVLKLNKDRIDWRDNTVIVLDNASYHGT